VASAAAQRRAGHESNCAPPAGDRIARILTDLGHFYRPVSRTPAGPGLLSAGGFLGTAGHGAARSRNLFGTTRRQVSESNRSSLIGASPEVKATCAHAEAALHPGGQHPWVSKDSPDARAL
jgi:hypothetical protein